MLLEAHGLTAVLSGDAGDVRVLDGVGLALDSGEIADIVGPSGSGKTTLLRALARLMPGATGSLSLEGTPAEQIAPAVWRRSVALLPQKPAMLAGSVRDNLLVPWRLAAHRGRPLPGDRELAQRLGALAVDASLDRDAARLSVGQAARVAFLRVLLAEPRVLLLDEPDAALDDAAAASLADALRGFLAGGGAIARVRHHVSDGLATRRLRLEGGRLTAEEVRS